MIVSKKTLTLFIVLACVLTVRLLQTIRESSTAQTVVNFQRLKGNPQAGVIVLEFTDFQCPACSRAIEPLDELVKRSKDKLAVEHKYFPLPSHKNSRSSALFAECASEQGKFWPVHDWLFKNQSSWADLENPWPYFMEIAAGFGLDLKKIKDCSLAEAPAARIDADQQEGVRLGVKATPTFVVDGKLVIGLDNLKYEFSSDRNEKH